jgi:hypothetical protein
MQSTPHHPEDLEQLRPYGRRQHQAKQRDRSRAEATLEGKGPPFVQKTTPEHPGRRIEIWTQDEARVGPQGTLTRRGGLTNSRPTTVPQSA